MPRPLSVTVTEPVRVQDHLNQIGVTGQSLVDGVIDHLIDHVVQARAVVGVADIHARPFAHRVQALENLDGIGAVFRLFGNRIGHEVIGSEVPTGTGMERPRRTLESAAGSHRAEVRNI